MKRILFIFPAVLFLFESAHVHGQEITAKRDSVSRNTVEIISSTTVISLAGFRDEDYIGIGVGIGAEYTLPIDSAEIVSAVASTMFILNRRPVDEDMNHMIDVPVLAGFRCQGNLSPSLSFYGDAQAGISFVKLFSEKPSSFAAPFGFSVQTGLIVNERLNVGIRYFNSFPKIEIEGRGTKYEPENSMLVLIFAMVM